MILIVTEGEYSGYGLTDVLARDSDLTADERARLDERFFQYQEWRRTKHITGAESPEGQQRDASGWADVLVSEFGFRRIEWEEFHGGDPGFVLSGDSAREKFAKDRARREANDREIDAKYRLVQRHWERRPT